MRGSATGSMPTFADPARPGLATLLEGGLVVDGSGGPSWVGDVLIVGDRIARVGAGLHQRLPDVLAPHEVTIVDCSGQAIAPGFIDAHTHDDAIVLRDPAYLAKLSQGITTVVTGNCGISLAPYRTDEARPQTFKPKASRTSKLESMASSANSGRDKRSVSPSIIRTSTPS